MLALVPLPIFPSSHHSHPHDDTWQVGQAVALRKAAEEEAAAKAKVVRKERAARKRALDAELAAAAEAEAAAAEAEAIRLKEEQRKRRKNHPLDLVTCIFYFKNSVEIGVGPKNQSSRNRTKSLVSIFNVTAEYRDSIGQPLQRLYFIVVSNTRYLFYTPLSIS